MLTKKILWKSDLWQFTVAIGVMTLFCLISLTLHLAKGEDGEAFAMGVVTLIPAVLTIVCAFTDRNEAMSGTHLRVDEELLADRIARLKDPKRPPPIG